MRISSHDIARQQRLAQDVARTQTQVATGKRIRAPSDDPLASARAATIARVQSDDATWKGNLSLAASLAGQADGVLASLSDRMGQARELLLTGASGTTSAADRATLADALRAVADDVGQLAGTTNSLGAPLFTARAMRVDSSTLLNPVVAAADVFARAGVPLTDDLTEAAAALDSGDATRIGAALSRLDGAIGHVADAHANQGIRADRIDRLLDANAARSIDLAIERSGLEDTDLTEAIARLNAQQITLEAAQAAFARINRQSLFDILG